MIAAEPDGSPSRASVREADCFAREGLPRRFGRYVLLRLLARGGMGQVLLASTTGVPGAERPVVIKVIRREYAKDPNFLARFLDEARVQAQLQHSGVAQVLEAAIHEPTGDPFVVMEYIEGRSLGNLRRRLSEVGMRLSWEQVVAAGVLISEALTYIHERRDASGQPLGIVHRDLSPHNVMIGYHGEVKVIDFGTARGQNRRCHTVAGVVFAKPGYVAPEVAGGDSGDFRADMYALGVMLWELCAGRRFLQGDAQEHTRAVAAGERNLPPIASLIGAPAELDRVIAKMTAHHRDRRYKSSRGSTTALAALLEDAAPLVGGERGVRARVGQLMYQLYPAQPGRGRRELGRLLEAARAKDVRQWRPEPCAAADDAQQVGDGVLAGTRYRACRELGRGASSVVLEAEHVDLERRVAIKLLDAEHTHSQQFATRFRREARVLSRLHHQGLVKVHDFGQTADGRLYCVMELLEGHSLRALLDQGEHFGWRRALRVVRQACLALQVAHDHDLVHRDIKPANLLLGHDDQVKLIDFGLARHADELGDAPAVGEGEEGGHALGAMTLFGTPEYMAPEQVAGAHVDHRADVYALGCVLYEMLTGRLPFADEGGGAVQILDAKLRGSPESVCERAPARRIPRAVGRIVSRALARHPSRRVASAAELAAGIASLLAEPARVRARRRSVGAAVVAAVMAFAVVLVVGQAKPLLEALPGKLPWLGAEVPAARTASPAQRPPTAAPSAHPEGAGAGHDKAAPRLDAQPRLQPARDSQALRER